MTYVQATAANIKEGYSTVWRHRLLVVTAFAVFMAISVGIIAMIPRSYKASANVLIVNGNTRNDPTLSSPDLPMLATSTGVLTRVAQNLGLNIPLLALKKSVTAKPPAYKSGIMRIEYADASPDRAALIANGVADELVRYYNQLSTARYDDDLRALDQELANQKARIQRIDARLQARGGIQSATQTRGQDGVDPMSDLQTQRALANAQLQGDAAQADAWGTDLQTRSEIARRDILAADPVYKALQAEATTSAAQLATLRSQFTDRYPGLPQLQAKVQSLRKEVAQEESRALSSPHAFSPTVAAAASDQRKAEAVVEADRAKVAALDGEIARRNRQLDSQAPLELLRLEREAAMTAYGSIASHRGATLLDRADALSLGSVVVIDRALGSQAQAGVGPRRLVATFGLLSLLLALAFAFLVEQLNPRLRRAAHIESLYGRPVIATLGKSR
jgi:uncharacterized protein involved in exopolysaccharide biosynthesis